MRYGRAMNRIAHLIFALAVFLPASRVAAHAEEPSARSVHVLQDGLLVRANFGVLSSAAPHRFVCEEAFLGGDNWLLGELGPTEWLTFGEKDIRRTEDGCSFEVVATVTGTPADAAVHPASGSVAYLDNDPDGGGLFVSTDRGQSFERHEGLAAAGLQLTGVRFLDAMTLLVSAYSTDADRAAQLYRVAIGGSVEPLAVPPGLTFAVILDAGAGQIALLARRESQGVMLWGAPDSLDAAIELETPVWPTGARLSSDGDTLWIAGLHDGLGLTRGVRNGASASWAELFTEDAAGCIGGDDSGLYTCGLARLDGADIFRIEGDSRTPHIDFREMIGPAQCPETSDVGEICPVVWQEIASYFGVDPDADTGAGPDHHHGPDAGAHDHHGADSGDPGVDAELDAADAGAPDDFFTGPVRGGGCATTGDARRGQGFLIVLGLLGAGLRRRLAL